jgi:peptidyl-prolyl cis-trans isomerase SurA
VLISPPFDYLRFSVPALLVLLFLAVGAAVTPAQAAARAPITDIDRIVAVVNDDVITATELKERLTQTEQQLATQQIKPPPEDVLKRQVLERMIVEDIQLQLAAHTGIRVTDQDVERAIQTIAERNKMSVSDLYDTVRRQGFDRSAYHDQIRKQVTIQKLIDREITSRISVSESEVQNYLENAAARAHRDSEYNVSHIYIPVPESATTEQIAASKRRAQEVERLLRGGEDFARAAVTYSQGPDALTGGALGWKSAAQLPELFVNALEKLEPGDITAVLRGPNGFHILRLNARRNATVTEESVQQTHVRHILLRPSEIQSLSEVRGRLLDIRRRLEAGADFAELAKTYSEDAVSAANGGDLGWVSPNQLVPAFEHAMDALQPGEISQPVQTPFGLHLIQVLGRRQQTVTGQRDLAAARRQILARKADDRYEQWVRQLRDEAYVEYLLDDVN